jgi:hypothetical protein
MTTCNVCDKNEAQQNGIYGYLPCVECVDKQRQLIVKNRPTEFTTDSIKEERKAYRKEIIQPFRDGQLSKEYVEQYGGKGIVAEEAEIKNAQNVWSEDLYYKQ